MKQKNKGEVSSYVIKYILNNMLLVASLLGNVLAAIGVIRAGERTARVGYGSRRSSSKKFHLKKNLIQPHPLTNFEIQTYYQNEPRFNGVYSRDNVSDKIKHGAYVINRDEYSDIGTQFYFKIK